jgi:hypothetical protein
MMKNFRFGNKKHFVALLLTCLPGMFFAKLSAEEKEGGVTTATPPQHVSLELSYRPEKGVEEARVTHYQVIESPESVAALEQRLASAFGGKYRLHRYPPFYVIRDGGRPVPEGKLSIKSLDVPMDLVLKDATVWEAVKAWNLALNDLLARDGLTNKLGWGFNTPWGPRILFEKKCVNINFSKTPAREVLLEIMRQSPMAISYTYFGGKERSM